MKAGGRRLFILWGKCHSIYMVFLNVHFGLRLQRSGVNFQWFIPEKAKGRCQGVLVLNTQM
jgi:hypothetical protein